MDLQHVGYGWGLWCRVQPEEWEQARSEQRQLWLWQPSCVLSASHPSEIWRAVALTVPTLGNYNRLNPLSIGCGCVQHPFPKKPASLEMRGLAFFVGGPVEVLVWGQAKRIVSDPFWLIKTIWC